MIELINVTKTYKTKDVEVKALDNISITFPSTGLVFINGKSGCGKTTLLNVIGGLDGIDDGEIFVQDKKLSDFSVADYDAYRNTFIGFIFQEYNLLPEFSVEKNIQMAMELQGKEMDKEKLEKLLADMEIAGLKNRKISELSGGQRQRVAIARALVKQPRIIMADEPTGAVDSTTGIQVLDILKKLSKDTLVIVVSHDIEFAEKYADRIIYLVDGKVEKDVSFIERELENGLTENEETVFVREGAALSENEKNTLANAVHQRKKIEIIKNLSYRERAATGEVVRDTKNPQALTISKMKLRSAAAMGVKSVAVKPVRLFITVLISALAFAVFALFDAIANFNTVNVLERQLKTCLSKTVVTTAEYIVDEEEGDKYAVKLSKDVIGTMESKTGGKVKGIFNLSDNTAGNVRQSISIDEILGSEMVVGKSYYANSVIGFVEFNPESEISENGKFKDFEYTLVQGTYPQLSYENDVLVPESMHQIAISTYLADSIIYYLNGKPLNEKQIKEREDLIGASISIQQEKYTIVGLIDCGEIPEKYDLLQQYTPYNAKKKALIDDFGAYINSGGHKCLFAPNGFVEAYKQSEKMADVYYAGNVSLTLYLAENRGIKQVEPYVLNAEKHTTDNVVFFNDAYGEDGKVSLADDEIIINYVNLQNLYASEISEISARSEREYASKLIADMSSKSATGNRAALKEFFTIIGVKQPDSLSCTIRQKFTKTGEKQEKEIKIVGVFFNVDMNKYATASRYKFMMNKNLMQALQIYSGQGDYSKLLFSAHSTRKGVDVLTEHLTAESGLTLSWYNNSVLSLIKENEVLVRQVADLFLWSALALALVSVFMLYNYMSTSISSKKRSVGVLRALGAGRKDVLLTFLSESLIISAFNGILANIFAVVGASLVNTYIVEVMNISVQFVLFGIRQVWIISVITLLTGILSSILPIFKIAKKTPVELIRLS